MCKLLIIPKVKNQNLTQEFISAAQSEMTRHDNDGIGYAALTEDGVAIERFLDTVDFGDWGSEYKPRDSISDRMLALSDALVNSPLNAKRYAASGPIDSDWSSVIVHSRFATSGRGIDCTHPFTKDNTTLAHNGVIQAKVEDWVKDTATECDTEELLNGYIDSEVAYNANKIQFLSDNILGYFAFGAFTEVDHGQYILDIVRDGDATLYCAWIDELGSEVYATSRSIIDSACIDLGWSEPTIIPVKDCTLIRYYQGEVVDVLGFSRVSEDLYTSHYTDHSKTKHKIGTVYVQTKSGDLEDISTYEQLDRLAGDVGLMDDIDELDEDYAEIVSEDPNLMRKFLNKRTS